MTKDDKNQEIVDYLVAIKKLATDGCYDFVPRRKNMLSLMQRCCENIIFSRR